MLYHFPVKENMDVEARHKLGLELGTISDRLFSRKKTWMYVPLFEFRKRCYLFHGSLNLEYFLTERIERSWRNFFRGKTKIINYNGKGFFTFDL